MLKTKDWTCSGPERKMIGKYPRMRTVVGPGMLFWKYLERKGVELLGQIEEAMDLPTDHLQFPCQPALFGPDQPQMLQIGRSFMSTTTLRPDFPAKVTCKLVDPNWRLHSTILDTRP